jgi:hypothetical protein
MKSITSVKASIMKRRTPKERRRYCGSDPQYLVGLANIRQAWRLVDDIDEREGRLAYIRYNVLMRRLAHIHGYKLKQVTAAFCALSSNNDYAGNLRSLVSVMLGHSQGYDPKCVIVSTYNACKLRAWEYLDGVEFLDRAKGPKIRSFYQNILDPTDPVPVTVDGHMLSIWQGKRFTMKEAVRFKFKYPTVAEGFRAVGQELGYTPCQVQAILWFAWKRIHNVVYDATLNLLNARDHWRVLREPDSIAPYQTLPQGKQSAECVSTHVQEGLW